MIYIVAIILRLNTYAGVAVPWCDQIKYAKLGM